VEILEFLLSPHVLFNRWVLVLAGVLVLVRVLLPKSNVTSFEFWREIVIVVGAYFCYFFVRSIVEGREFEAFGNATEVIHLERTMGIFWEVPLQTHITDIEPLRLFFNATYVWGHWPVIILGATWLFLSHRDGYYVFRNAFLISGTIGLIIFATVPVAPPRFMQAWGFVDTVYAYHLGPQTSMLINEYAAMPSLHFGWNLLMGMAIVRYATWLPARVMGAMLPVAMFMAIVLTGNHYILDGLAGGTVALLALGLAATLRRIFERYGPTPTMPTPAGAVA
jgi:hypothetical protein